MVTVGSHVDNPIYTGRRGRTTDPEPYFTAGGTPFEGTLPPHFRSAGSRKPQPENEVLTEYATCH
ncbi:hypothetical protein GCM10022630_07980 [Thermobifida alba]